MNKFKDFKKALWEHLKTRKKYNTLEIKLISTREDNEKLVVQLNTEKRINAKKREAWEKALTEQEQEIIELKEEIKKLRSRKRKKKEEV